MLSLIRSAADIDRFMSSKIPEGPSLEYKETIPLSSRDERREALKDLSGMGNGGGGTILIGIKKDTQDPELPSRVVPLTDRGLVGRLEDILRAGIRPYLLATYTPVDYGAGFVLVADVLRSPLGPYMVEVYEDRRYYMRIGSRTEPMSEQKIRDAYMLATRARERRPTVWEEHQLPLRPLAAAPYLCVSALPEEPLLELLDLGSVKLEELQPPAELGALRGRAPIPRELFPWAYGLFGEQHTDEGLWICLQLYRDGAIGSAVALPAEFRSVPLARTLHAQLAYMAWIWGKFDLHNLVEIRLDLYHIQVGSLDERGDFGRGRLLTAPRPTDLTAPLVVSIGLEELPSNLSRARSRNRLVKRFLDQVYQAYGRQRAPAPMFTSGWLYGSDGKPLGVSVVGAGLCRRTKVDATVGRIYADGYVERARDATQIGYFVDGVLLDREGNAMAAVEIAVGSGLPDDFVVQSFTDDVLTSCFAPEPLPSQQRIPPTPTGIWSGSRLPDFVV